jgi:hypothetical protein
MMDISTPYYEDLTRISNSNIGWFLNKGPAYLHKMLTDPPPEEKNPVLERGTMIHEYLLQPEEFQKDYVIWDKSRPSSAQQEKFCQAYASSLEIEPNKAILEAYKAAYSTKGKTEETMLSEGSKIASTLKDYIDYLKSGDQRIMIGPYDYQMLKKIRNNIEAHKLAKPLLAGPVAERVWKFGADEACKQIEREGMLFQHEFHINWDYEGKIKCKSLLDSLTLDFQEKKATIMDLKTTAKLWHFEESIEMYDYLRQLDYYSMAVRWYLVSECGVTIDEIFEWEFEYYIIGIDTTGSYEIRVFKIEQKDVSSRDETILTALDRIAWHQRENKWDHSIEYYTGDGSETLNL